MFSESYIYQPPYASIRRGDADSVTVGGVVVLVMTIEWLGWYTAKAWFSGKQWYYTEHGRWHIYLFGWLLVCDEPYQFHSYCFCNSEHFGWGKWFWNLNWVYWIDDDL